MTNVIVGVDVGGTNTDAVVFDGRDILCSAKTPTTPDVTSGVRRAITLVLNEAERSPIKGNNRVYRIHIGTTHFVNAVVQRRDLVKVAVIRLCGKAAISLPPYSDFPADLKQIVCGGVFLVKGGYEFDGKTEIAAIHDEEILEIASELKEANIDHVVVSGIYSPINSEHEKQVQELLHSIYPELSITLSSDIGQLGLLERENAAILNESLKPLANRTVTAFREALDGLGLTCPFYLSQNDGTLLSADQALQLPVQTFASGPTNSMRGATFLLGLEDAVVIDIGGTTADIGVITKGFPREAGSRSKVGGVSTNFRMPDVLSIGLGGGSIVRPNEDRECKIGPDSVGYRLSQDALVFGGSTLTATDIAVSAGLVNLGRTKIAHLSVDVVNSAMDKMHTMLENAIGQVKVQAVDMVAVLVGGGSVLIDTERPLKGISSIRKPPSFSVANAVGAALSQISGYVDHVFNLEEVSRKEAIKQATDTATTEAIKSGADPKTIQMMDKMEVPLSYLPGKATRVKIKVVGDLLAGAVTGAVKWNPCLVEPPLLPGVTQVSSSTGGSLNSMADVEDHLTAALQETEPVVDPVSGEWLLSPWDVECISVGAGILGCGGGGSPNIGRLRALHALQQGRTIRVIHPERMKSRMKSGDRVCPIAIMGSPTICIERLPSDEESLNALQAIKDLYNYGEYDDGEGIIRNTDEDLVHHEECISYMDNYEPATDDMKESHQIDIVGLVCAEVGGSNSIEPLLVGALTGLPVVDCDGMGRAFPELQMFAPMIYGMKPYPSTLADYSGRRAVVLKANTPKDLENHFRKVVCEMGFMATFTFRPMEKEDITTMMVAYSMSRAWRLGRAVLSARRSHSPPVEAIIDHEGAHLLAHGKIIDVERNTAGGFAQGVVKLEGVGSFTGKYFKVNFQNENLVASLALQDGTRKVLACTPDLLTFVSTDTGEPVPTEEIRYGLRVSLLAIPAPPELTTPQALEVVGPQAFNYSPEEVTYIPVGTYMHHKPIPLM